MTALDQLTLMAPSPACVLELTRGEANDLLLRWGHYLGPCDRPFGQQAHALVVGGAPVSMAVGASTVSATVAGWNRRDVVELARLCSAPDAAWATRVMLRLWREALAPTWPHWNVRALVAYSLNERHDGRVYRFDGWRRVTADAGSTGGGGTWSAPRASGHRAAGRKSLWLWEVPK